MSSSIQLIVYSSSNSEIVSLIHSNSLSCLWWAVMYKFRMVFFCSFGRICRVKLRVKYLYGKNDISWMLDNLSPSSVTELIQSNCSVADGPFSLQKFTQICSNDFQREVIVFSSFFKLHWICSRRSGILYIFWDQTLSHS